MERRKIRDEHDARMCIAAVKASKLTVGEWARSEGVDGRSLRAWTLNLGRGASSAKATRARTSPAKPLRLVELIPSTPMAPAGASRYVVRVGAHVVEVDDRFAEATLRRLVKVLTSC